uniref:Putative secreted protein n=1 Tax=Anopheles triannulatus TaxID=58253 RepID=A0A2M4B6V3_9DIPT
MLFGRVDPLLYLLQLPQLFLVLLKNGGRGDIRDRSNRRCGGLLDRRGCNTSVDFQCLFGFLDVLIGKHLRDGTAR